MSSAKKASELKQTERLLDIMAKLRHPQDGCPWDVKQTMPSLTRYTIEEAYEVADAIQSGDMQEIRSELGDLLFQVVFYAQIAEEAGEFSFDSVAESISDKLERRHPHVFGDSTVDESELSVQWDKIKADEKAQKGIVETSILDQVPAGLPALSLAQKMQKQCAKVGFDWAEIAPVLDKVREEVDEIQVELDAKQINHQAVEEEIGDLLFAVVNLSRHANVDADTALRSASHKFAHRFRAVEQLAREQQRDLSTMSLTEMEALWQQVKSFK